MAKEDRKLTDFEQLEALLYRIIRKLNTIEIGVDDAAHGYYKEKKRTSGLTSKIKKLQEELGIEPFEPKYPRVNEFKYLPGQSITSKFRPEVITPEMIGAERQPSPMDEDLLYNPREEVEPDIDDSEEIMKRKDEGT